MKAADEEDDDLELPPEDGDTDETEVPLGAGVTLPDADEAGGDPYDDRTAADDEALPTIEETEGGSDDQPFGDDSPTDELDVGEEAPWGDADEGASTSHDELDDDEDSELDDGSEGPLADEQTLPELAAVLGDDDDEDDRDQPFLHQEPYAWADLPWVEALRHPIGDVAALGVVRGELLAVVRHDGRAELIRVGPEGDTEVRCALPSVSRASFEGSDFLLEAESPVRVSGEGTITNVPEYQPEESEDADAPQGVVIESSTTAKTGVAFAATRSSSDRSLVLVERSRGAEHAIATLESELRIEAMVFDTVRELLWIGGAFGVRAYRQST